MSVRPLSQYWIFLIALGLVHTVSAQPDFRAIDRHARHAPESLQQDLPALTAYLVEPAETDLEKVRALYTWITGNLTYDTEAYRNGNRRINQHNRDILRRRKAVCFGYASLFKAMCEAAGLEAEVVSGYSKGTLTATPDLDKPDHAWNAVRIKGEWQLLDATWGSSLGDRSDPFVREKEKEYFLADPAAFVLTHLPAQPMWQLLPCPIGPGRFIQPADSTRAFLAETEPCFDFRDTLAQFLAASQEQQRLISAEQAHRFNPTPATRSELAHTLLDHAGRLADRAETLQGTDQPDSLIQLQARIIRHCERAQTLTDLYDWQVQLWVNTLINQAVALYQSADATDDPRRRYRQALDCLQKAEQLLANAGDSYFINYSREKCRTYREVIEIQLAD